MPGRYPSTGFCQRQAIGVPSLLFLPGQGFAAGLACFYGDGLGSVCDACLHGCGGRVPGEGDLVLAQVGRSPRPGSPADRTAARRPSRAENEKAARRGLEAPRIALRRQVTTAAAAAGSEHEFFACLDQAGVLVRKRFSVKSPSEVTGYSVALPGDTIKDRGPVWYGGGKLSHASRGMYSGLTAGAAG
jgi:hypothetical protein